MKNKDIKEIQEALKSSDEKKEEVIANNILGATFKIDDLSKLADKYFSKKSKKILTKRLKELKGTNESGIRYRSLFIAFRVRDQEIEKAVKKVCEITNQLVDRDLVCSSLSPVLSFKLAKTPLIAPSSVVLLYIHVPEDKYESIKKELKDSTVDEGEDPNDFGDMSPDLKDGEFLNEYRITHGLAMLEKDPEEALQTHIDMVISILPSGTEVREVTKCAIFDLSIPYEIKFYNPKLKKVKYIELEYRRDCVDLDGRVSQFNMLTEIKYLDKNKRNIYKLL